MTRLIVLVLMAFMFPVSAEAKGRKPKEDLKETLVALEKQSWVAWQKRDGKFFSQFLSPDHVEVGSTGIANATAVAAFVGSPICVIKSYSVDKFNFVQLNADAAVLTYYAEQDTTCNGSPVPSPAWVSSVYVRRNGHWLNALYQQTPARK
ncbi:MAG TPA: nuclear transport factor 2 family protein [Pyrinomonadaceae bacterium]|nr:nuclear transport factor 2 family protein [Pyrinomonadaceae bacterium]